MRDRFYAVRRDFFKRHLAALKGGRTTGTGSFLTLGLSILITWWLLMLGFWTWREAREACLATQTRLDALVTQRNFGAADVNATRVLTASSPDFAQKLPTTPQVELLTTELDRSSRSTGSALLELSPREADSERLGRSEISVTVRGSYPKIKQLLSEVLSRFSNATLRRLTLKQIPSSAESEASFVIALWTKPREPPGTATVGSP